MLFGRMVLRFVEEDERESCRVGRGSRFEVILNSHVISMVSHNASIKIVLRRFPAF